MGSSLPRRHGNGVETVSLEGGRKKPGTTATPATLSSDC
jgi:hypothetical protein